MDWEKYKEISLVIVDNDSFARELLSTIFKQKTPLKVYTFSNAIEALDYLKENKIELLLLDLDMPKIGGEEFIETLKIDEKLNTPLVILMTTYRMTKVELKKLGVDYCMSKPFDFGNIVSEIYTYLEMR